MVCERVLEAIGEDWCGEEGSVGAGCSVVDGGDGSAVDGGVGGRDGDIPVGDENDVISKSSPFIGV